MFNVITADMIKALPPVDGVDAERLPLSDAIAVSGKSFLDACFV